MRPPCAHPDKPARFLRRHSLAKREGNLLSPGDISCRSLKNRHLPLPSLIHQTQTQPLSVTGALSPSHTQKRGSTRRAQECRKLRIQQRLMDTWGCAPRRSRSRRPAAMPRLRSPQQRSQRQPRGISHPAGEQPAGAPAGAAAAASPHAQSPGPRARARPALTDAQQRCPEGETEPRVQQREPRHGGGAGRGGTERSGAADTGPAGRERVT